ncbi:MAG: ARMT1-like domain-containing protein [Thermoplasmata archaeon]
MQPECVPCLLKRCVFEARIVDESKERKVIEEALSILNDRFEPGCVSAEVATEVHKRVYDILGTDDPYKELKNWSNEAAEKLLPRAEEIVEEKGFKGAALVSIAGNVLDFGYRDDLDSPDYFLEEFEGIIEEGLGYDDTENVKGLLEDAEDVIYFTDNAGEIVLDTLLMKKIKEYGVHLTVVVKGEPIITDATMEDAIKYGVDEIADELITTERYAIGIPFWDMPQGLKDHLDKADVIIAKGMANWESFSETDYRPIAYFTRSKCIPVSKAMDVPYEKNIVKLFE